MSLSDIVSITISKETATVSRVGFGTPMILSNEADSVFNAGERARTYTSTSAMITDGFTSGSTTMEAASRFFAQSPKVASIIVGRRTNLVTMSIDLTPIVLASTLYTVTINGTAFTFTSDATPTAAEIVTGLETAINLGTEPVTATDNATHLSLDADVAGEVFTLVVDRSQLTQDDKTVEAGIVADVTAVRTDLTGSDDWYVIVLDSHGTLEIEALAAHIETLQKFFVVSSADDDIIAGTAGNLGLTLQAADYARTSLMVHSAPHTSPESAWAGSLLPKDPGSATWKFKSLTGVAFSSFTPTEKATLISQACNYYIRTSGNNWTTEGVTASGEFNDITRGIDWTAQRMQENIFGALINADKISFTDAGIGVITNEVWGVLREGQSNNLYARSPEPIVTAPLAENVSSANKTIRNLPDVEFIATLAGAIHAVTVTGRVVV
jgi:hypothetical protein